MVSALASLLKAPLRWLLDVPAIRNRVVSDLRQRHEADLVAMVPLGHGLSCPVFAAAHWFSFNEIFLAGEYDSVLKQIPPPARWLDLGCHAGFFSLHLAWQLRRRGVGTPVESLLVDADKAVETAVCRSLATNALDGVMRFAHGAIGPGDGAAEFIHRSHMASSMIPVAQLKTERISRVPVLDESAIMQLLPPPYDLVKLDVEGGEFHFLRSYPRVLAATRHLLMEWHSWHSGGGGPETLLRMAREQGFELVSEIVASHPAVDPSIGNTGVWLLARKTPQD